VSRRNSLTNALLIWVACGLVSLVPAQPVAKAKTGGTIAGQVLDADGSPVAGATVRLVSGPYPGLPELLHDFLPWRGPAFEATAKTDDSGRFRILASNRYMICLCAEHRASGTIRMSAPIVPVMPGDYRILTLRKAVAVTGVVRGSRDDKPIAGADVLGSIQTAPSSGFAAEGFTLGVRTVTDKNGAYRLWVPRGSSLGLEAWSGGHYVQKAPVTAGPGQDFVLGAGNVIEGVVQGPDGKPAANAVVQDPYLPRCRTVTNTDGTFRLLLGANRYWLHVAHPQLAHGVDYDQRAVRLARGAAGRDGARAKPRVLRLQKGTSLKARVVGPEGRPLGGATVVLAGIPKRLNGNGMLGKVVAWPARLDEAGALNTSCTYPGYLAYAWVELHGEFVLLFGDDVGSGIDLGDVRLPLAGRLSGTVQLPSRMPAAGARVLLRRRFDNQPQILRSVRLPLPFHEVATDRAGRFRIDGLRPGKYDVAVVAPNHFPHLLQAKVSTDDQRLRIAMPPGKTMRGVLVDSNDQPVPHRPIRIYLHNDQAQNTYRQLGFQMFEPITDEHGRFAYHGLPGEHKYRVYVYFRVDNQLYRGIAIPNVDADAQDVRLSLTTPGPGSPAAR